jgi:hypothetical protein
MSTSEFGYLVTMDTSKQLAANTPCDVVAARTLLNNANHLQDEFAQVLVNWSDAGYTGAAVSGYAQLLFWEFPISVRQNGDAYPFRIRIGGYATGGATVTFRAIISAPGAAGPALHSQTYGDQDFLTASAGLSNAWLTGTSQGPAASATLLQLPASLVSTRQMNTLDTLGGNSNPVTLPFARLTVYGITSKTSDPPVLGGVYLAQYIGT